MAERISLQEALDSEGMTLEEMLEESMFGMMSGVPALCEEYCMVEPDGNCPHGHPSTILAAGFI